MLLCNCSVSTYTIIRNSGSVWGIVYLQFNVKISLDRICNIGTVSSVGKDLLESGLDVSCTADKLVHQPGVMYGGGINHPTQD